MRFKILGSFLVVFFLLQMLTTIQFNDKLGFWRAEIWNVISNSMLSPKIDSKLVIANP